MIHDKAQFRYVADFQLLFEVNAQEPGRRSQRRCHFLDRTPAIEWNKEDLCVAKVTADLHLREGHQPHPRILDLPTDEVGDQTQDLILDSSAALEVTRHLRETS